MRVIALLLLMTSVALAEGATVQTSPIVDALTPVLTAIGTALATVVTAASVQVVLWLRKKLKLTDSEAIAVGLQIDAHQRDALQTALTNAAGLALNRLGNEVRGKTIDVKNQAVADAVNSVIKSAPDAVAYFKLDKRPGEIAEKIVAKIPQVANTTESANGSH